MSDTFIFNPIIFEKIYEQYSDFIKFVNAVKGIGTGREVNQIKPLTKTQLQKLLKIALWASLKQEEGRFHNFNLCVIPKEDCLRPFAFDEPIKFNETNLAKLSPAFDWSANSIGVWHGDNETLKIWGFASTKESRSVEFSCEVINPGQILVSFRGYKLQDFSVFITGIETKVVKTNELLSWMIPGYDKTKNTLKYRLNPCLTEADYKTIVTSMRAHKHGGTLLVVDKLSDWKKSIRKPITNAGSGYKEIKHNIHSRNKLLEEQSKKNKWERIRLGVRNPELDSVNETVNKGLKVIGNLTAIDGATVITCESDILAFGVKIEAKEKPKKVLLLTPFENEESEEIKLSDLGNTRHQSAVQFVFERRGAIAFVASQDGTISLMKWNSDTDVCVVRPAEVALL